MWLVGEFVLIMTCIAVLVARGVRQRETANQPRAHILPIAIEGILRAEPLAGYQNRMFNASVSVRTTAASTAGRWCHPASLLAECSASP